MLVFSLGRAGGVRAQYRKFHCLTQLRGNILPVQPSGTAHRALGPAVCQRGGGHPLAAQEIRRSAPRCLHQRQQQVAGVGLPAALLPRQPESSVYDMHSRMGTTFKLIEPEHPHFLLCEVPNESIDAGQINNHRNRADSAMTNQ